ncbi:hypothetical protein RvY_17326-1 [Ramazzottius varieornatus]|uniref:Uncharacterized protein n=1 Tax=Ramazzottius varieornatus TaxID=947166 RepID=A0A1D1W8U3_RAMVA|nr:hypothetical protein RvY_17326-1 [Ramazzottius varieornatus]
MHRRLPSKTTNSIRLKNVSPERLRRWRYLSGHTLESIFAAKFCEQIGQRMLTISCAKYSAAEALRAIDKDDVPLMEALMAGNHKETVALNPMLSPNNRPCGTVVRTARCTTHAPTLYDSRLR